MHPSVKRMRLNNGRNKLAMGLATQVCESWVKSQCPLVVKSKFLCYKNPSRNNDIVAQEGISRWATQLLSPSSHHIICGQLSPSIVVPSTDVAFIRLASPPKLPFAASRPGVNFSSHPVTAEARKWTG